jgi:hypothetical protein
VCGGKRKKESGREVVCVGCRHAAGEEKSKTANGKPGKERKAEG